MTIRKGSWRVERNFAMISNSWLRDERLSWDARGMLGYISSHRDDFEMSEDHLINASPAGRDKVRRIIRELKTLNYLVRKRVQDPATGVFTGEIEWVLQDPSDMDDAAAAASAERALRRHTRRSGEGQFARSTGNPSDGEIDHSTGNPSDGPAPVDNSHLTGNPSDGEIAPDPVDNSRSTGNPSDGTEGHPWTGNPTTGNPSAFKEDEVLRRLDLSSSSLPSVNDDGVGGEFVDRDDDRDISVEDVILSGIDRRLNRVIILERLRQLGINTAGLSIVAAVSEVYQRVKEGPSGITDANAFVVGCIVKSPNSWRVLGPHMSLCDSEGHRFQHAYPECIRECGTENPNWRAEREEDLAQLAGSEEKIR